VHFGLASVVQGARQRGEAIVPVIAGFWRIIQTTSKHFSTRVLLAEKDNWMKQSSSGAALALRPEHAQAHHNLGVVWLRGKFDDAVRSLERALRCGGLCGGLLQSGERIGQSAVSDQQSTIGLARRGVELLLRAGEVSA